MSNNQRGTSPNSVVLTPSNSDHHHQTKITVMDLSSPRPLTPDESQTLTSLLRSNLKLTNCSCVLQAEEDATDLLNYALDMVGDGESVGKVLEELAFMEMEICDDAVLDNLGEALVDFLIELLNSEEGNDKVPYIRQRELDAASASADALNAKSLEEELLCSENHISVDFSAKTAADKNMMEIASLFGGRNNQGGSLKDRMAMYNEKGEIIKHIKPSDDDDLEELNGAVPGKSIDELRRDELMFVMNDRSLTKNEKSKKMDEVRAKYGVAEAKQAARRVTKIAMAAAARKDAAEAMPPSTSNRTSSSSLLSSDDHHKDKHVHFAGGGMNGSGPILPCNPDTDNGNKGVDLSAKAAAAKHAKEMASLFGGKNKRSSLKDRMSMYNEKGEIIKSNKQDTDEGINHIVKEKSVDELRREELMEVMKDKSLDKKEKARRMDEIREKYNGGSAVDNTVALSSEGNSPNRQYIRNSSTNSQASMESNFSDNHEIPPPTQPNKGGEGAASAVDDLYSGDFNLRTPRPLTLDESSTVTSLLRSNLKLTNCSCVLQAEEDATDLLNYALDMIGDGEPVGKVLEELSLMGMEICDDEVIDNLGETLIDFLIELLNNEEGNGKVHWRRQRELDAAATAAALNSKSLEEEFLCSENHVSIDFSAKTAADKNKMEMASLFGGKNTQRGSLKDRMAMYNEKGEIIKSNKQDTQEETRVVKESSVDELRREELMKVMKDKTLDKKEKARRMDEIREKYNGGSAAAVDNTAASPSPGSPNRKYIRDSSSTSHGSMDSISSYNEDPPPAGGVDLSAKAASSKNAREIASLFGKRNGVGGDDLLSSNARESYQRQLQADSEVLRTPSSNKLGVGGAKVGGRNSIKTENDKPITANNDPPSLDQQRRAELQVIMRDSSLKKDERRKKMDEVKEKYAVLAAQEEPAGGAGGGQLRRRASDCSSQGSITMTNGRRRSIDSNSDNEAPPPKGGVDLSAKAASEKYAREMASLFGNKNGGGGDTLLSSNARESYQRQLHADAEVLRTPSSNKLGVGGAKVGGRNSLKSENNKPTTANNDPPSLDQQRRAELQVIMRDRSLTKDERQKKMEEVKAKYAVLAAAKNQDEHTNGRGGGQPRREASDSALLSALSSEYHNRIATNNDQEEKMRRASPSATSSASSSKVHCTANIDLSAKSYAEKPAKELESIAVTSLSLSERKSMYNNQSTIVAGRGGGEKEKLHKPKRTLGLYSKHRSKTVTTVDPTAFAVAENGLYGVQRDKKKAVRSEYGGRF